ncbi:protein polyglycylase TTLL10-like isoform X2 [Polyodon spathula]|uniref:protein polyglycylase TTLL10-like isoform X2 n=1 Tax=Polyodon spathula TaxID=7913 RepID=UPI001B7E7E4A|nr:protein polyglycylase TTLL10-like isoform X2 [Polyodon spathula]
MCILCGRSLLQKLCVSFKKRLKKLKQMKVNVQRRLQDPDRRWELRMKFLQQAKSYIGVPYHKRYHQPGSKQQTHDMVHVEIWLGEGERTLGARWHQGKVQVFDSYKFVSSSYGEMNYRFKSIETWLQGICVSHCSQHKWGFPKQLPSPKSIFYKEDVQEPSEEEIEPEESNSEPGIMQLKHGDQTEPSEAKPEKAKDLQDVLGTGSKVHSEGEINIDSPSTERAGGCASPKEREVSALDNQVQETCQSDAMPESKSNNILNDYKTETKMDSRANPKTAGATARKVKKKKKKKVECRGQGEEQKQQCASGPAAEEAPDGLLIESPDCRKAEGPSKFSFRRSSESDKKQEPKGPGPFFYIGGGNGSALVGAYCLSKGWQRINNKNREDYKLKWCETKSYATYSNFHQGEQLVYQIPNNKVLTTKIGLLSSLREYERVVTKVQQGRASKLLKLEDFFPDTFRMDVKEEREAFFALYEGLNQGRGIFLLKTAEDMENFRSRLQNVEENPLYRKIPFKSPQARIVQRYVQNPLLLEGKKFDIRSYFLIASTVPYMVFFRHGYVRLTCEPYDPNSNDLTAHLTNQYMQKKNPLYNELKEETVWSMERFNDYVNEKSRAAKGLPEDWVYTVFTKRMQQVVMQCFLAVKSKLECKLGYFDLIGCDFLIDEDFKVWLLEMNCNPALHTNCEVLKEVIPSVVNETLDLAFEIFNKLRKGQTIMPLGAQKDFTLLYNGELNDILVKPMRTRAAGANFQTATRPKSAAPPPPKPCEKKQRQAGPFTAKVSISAANQPLQRPAQGKGTETPNNPSPSSVKPKNKAELKQSKSTLSHRNDPSSLDLGNLTSPILGTEKTKDATVSMPVLSERSFTSSRPRSFSTERSPASNSRSYGYFGLDCAQVTAVKLQPRVPAAKILNKEEIMAADPAENHRRASEEDPKPGKEVPNRGA